MDRENFKYVIFNIWYQIILKSLSSGIWCHGIQQIGTSISKESPTPSSGHPSENCSLNIHHYTNLKPHHFIFFTTINFKFHIAPMTSLFKFVAWPWHEIHLLSAYLYVLKHIYLIVGNKIQCTVIKKHGVKETQDGPQPPVHFLHCISSFPLNIHSSNEVTNYNKFSVKHFTRSK